MSNARNKSALNAVEISELQKKKSVLQTLPKVFFRYHNLSLEDSFLENLSWEHIDTLQIEAQMYKDYRSFIYNEIKTLAKDTFAKACTKVETEEKEFNNYIKCGKPTKVGPYCSSCNPYKGLDSELKKLNTNTGSFNKHASNNAPFMRPVGVSNADHQRFVERLYLDKNFYPETSYPSSKQQPEKPQKYRPPIESKVIQIYQKKAKKLMILYPRDIIGRHKKEFYEIAVALKISDENQELSRYLDTYALANYLSEQVE